MSSLFQIGLREYAYSIFWKIRTSANVFYFSVYAYPRAMEKGVKWCRRSAVATVEATEAAASVKILTGAIIISVIKITIVTFNANSTIW